SVTWKELDRAVRGASLPLRARLSRGIRTSPHTLTVRPGWHALAYSTTNVERASGQHARDVLVIVEEASGGPDFAWEAIDGLKYSRLIAIGNPVRPDGPFVDLIRRGHRHAAEGVPDELRVHAIQIPSTLSPHAHLATSPYGLADATWL